MQNMMATYRRKGHHILEYLSLYSEAEHRGQSIDQRGKLLREMACTGQDAVYCACVTANSQ
jgi:hypothetical protein